jgi:hypothetical protein
MKNAFEVALVGMMYIRSLMKIGSGIQVILSLLPQQFEEPGYRLATGWTTDVSEFESW